MRNGLVVVECEIEIVESQRRKFELFHRAVLVLTSDVSYLYIY